MYTCFPEANSEKLSVNVIAEDILDILGPI